jgi:hypothetical protein
MSGSIPEPRSQFEGSPGELNAIVARRGKPGSVVSDTIPSSPEKPRDSNRRRMKLGGRSLPSVAQVLFDNIEQGFALEVGIERQRSIWHTIGAFEIVLHPRISIG